MNAALVRVVGAAEDGRRADVVLSGWLGEPRARTQQRLAAGEVRAEGTVIAKSRRLRAGERVEVEAPAAPPPAPPPPEVAAPYADDHLLVVAKPAGLVVHAGAGRSEPTLVDALTAMGHRLAPSVDADRPGIVHRLDRGTSGLLAVALTAEALHGLQSLLRRREVERRYVALVEGVPEPPRATVDAPIARHPTRRTRFSVAEGGRRAITHYDAVGVHGPAAVLDVRLETGRTHQVRVHMAAIGHPLVGDRAYGASSLGKRLGLDRPALHAARLAFTHPVTGKRIEVTEPLPADLRSALAALDAEFPQGKPP